MNVSVELNELLDTDQTATLLGLKRNTLEIYRHKGKGPPFIKMGTAPQAPVRYVRSAVMEWVENCSFVSTSAYSPAALANAKSHRSGTVGASA
jgi:predicted DNA-binding transcriptional regulator AlpA